MPRLGAALGTAAAVGGAMLFIGLIGDLRNFVIVGGAVLAVPVITVGFRLMVKPPEVLTSSEADLGVPLADEERTEIPHNQAQASLRDLGAERKPK